ncbi:MAG: bifunctional D-glycero-beta-D-manno-heptose-7-phosphate kinase/D-glycero-beta-D-manno-heptose 1-phosphate adenylyltransferase HldE [Agarilytica sp.]
MTFALPNFSGAKILVVGDIMLDRYWSGSTTRISPEAPVPVVKVGEIEDRLGGAANVALNIATLGCEVSLCGIIGNDNNGAHLKSLLKDKNIRNLCIEDNNNPTITKLRVISRHQQLIRMDFEESLANISENTLPHKIETMLKGFDAVVISDYAKGTVAQPQSIIEACNKNNVPVFIDPKGSDFSKYRGASFVTPNRSEFEGVVGTCENLPSIFTQASKLAASLDFNGILVTLSEKGMALASENAPPFHLPTMARDVFDVTGAGDTVIATLAASYASGSDIQSAMRLANLAAGVVVGKLGTSTVSSNELLEAMELDDRDIPRGSATLEELLKRVEASRLKGEKIVFTNGCFDILHAGHVRYLKAAGALGDRLIVAMNSDDSISRLKGASRPIVTLEERMEVMASLNCVDWVVPFSEDTPLELINKILPDVLAKGGDYAAEKIVGFTEVKKNGGEVKILPFVEGCSTTSIVEKIRQINKP